jgi:hypothetical protein
MSSIEEKLRLQKEERDKKAAEEKKARMAAAANRNTGAMALHQKVEQERLDRLNQERAAAEERVKERERTNQLALEKAIKDEQERQEKMIRERKEKTEASAEARGQKNRAALDRRDSALTEWKQKNEPLKEAEREQQLQKLYLARLERKTSSQQSPTSPRSHGVAPTSPRSHGVQFTTPSASTPTTTPSSEPSPTDDSSLAKLPPMLGSGSVTNSSSKKLLTPKPKKSVMFSRTVAVQDGTPKAKKRLLDKHNKGLTEVGEEVLQYTTLKKLILGSNKLSSLPDNFTVLECLEILDLSSNDITEDEDGVANLQILSKMPLLHEVDFTGNQIYKLPVMENLVILGLADNNLDAIPEEIFLFKKLSKLDLSHNHIQHLPNELFSLVTINVLILAYNDLVELPEEIGQLVNLKVPFFFLLLLLLLLFGSLLFLISYHRSQ